MDSNSLRIWVTYLCIVWFTDKWVFVLHMERNPAHWRLQLLSIRCIQPVLFGTQEERYPKEWQQNRSWTSGVRFSHGVSPMRCFIYKLKVRQIGLYSANANLITIYVKWIFKEATLWMKACAAKSVSEVNRDWGIVKNKNLEYFDIDLSFSNCGSRNDGAILKRKWKTHCCRLVNCVVVLPGVSKIVLYPHCILITSSHKIKLWEESATDEAVGMQRG